MRRLNGERRAARPAREAERGLAGLVQDDAIRVNGQLHAAEVIGGEVVAAEVRRIHLRGRVQPVEALGYDTNAKNDAGGLPWTIRRIWSLEKVDLKSSHLR